MHFYQLIKKNTNNSNIKDKENCCGCGACQAVCPKKCLSMQADDEGFLYPYIEMEKCIHCGKCERVCPQKQKCRASEFMPTAYAAMDIDDTDCLPAVAQFLVQHLMNSLMYAIRALNHNKH